MTTTRQEALNRMKEAYKKVKNKYLENRDGDPKLDNMYFWQMCAIAEMLALLQKYDLQLPDQRVKEECISIDDEHLFKYYEIINFTRGAE